MVIYGTRGIVPIGGVVGYLCSFSCMPALCSQGRYEWVAVAGQSISDVESPLNGQTLPDLNGTTDADKKFLRGANASGGTGGSSTHVHSNSGYACSAGVHCHSLSGSTGTGYASLYTYSCCYCWGYSSGLYCVYSQGHCHSLSGCASSAGAHCHTLIGCTCSATVVPPVYDVVWVVRIK